MQKFVHASDQLAILALSGLDMKFIRDTITLN